MKLNKILLTASLLFGSLCASAQTEVTEYVFQPHWFGQAQFGAQETLGEGAFNILAGPNAQLAVGYNFSPVFGLRLAANSWRSRGTSEIQNQRYKWHWSYVAPTVDALFNVTNLLGGYNPTRLVDVNIFAGIGANIAFKNDEANAINKAFNAAHFANANYGAINSTMLGYVWDGTKTRLVGKMGFDVNFNVTDRLQLGLELQANVLNDKYNSKRAGNADWYFNGLVGLKYAFGETYSTRTRVIDVPCEPQIVEKIVEKIVEVPVQVEEKKTEKAVFQRDVFFKINKSVIRNSEMQKVTDIADYLNAHPNAKVTITGYADKGTGTVWFNLRLAAKRAEAVATCLRKKYNIPASRMIVKSMGEDLYQPYKDPIKDRVAICIAEE